MSEPNKENLRKLLNFLNTEIIHKPENRWFVDELRKSLPRDSYCDNITDSPTIAKVEKYLALDYKLDESKTVLDFHLLRTNI